MKRKNFIKYLGLLGLSFFAPVTRGENYFYGTKEYPIRAILNRDAFRISELGIFASGKLIHKIPIRNFKMKKGDKLIMVLEIENQGK